ncbi:FAD-dependent oxidoreductase [Spirillospora sp. NPDC050679]
MTGHDGDLLILGGGPAGCAAARMAASLGLRSFLVEARTLCHRLRSIPAVDNVLGFSSGPAYADAIAADLADTPLCAVRTGTRIEHLAADDTTVTATLSDGGALTAPYAVIATGVRPLTPPETSWITGPPGLPAAPLWDASPERLRAGPALVLGADRPLGTLLRSHPALDLRLTVLHPAADDYKADEVRHDPRVTLVRVDDLLLQHTGGLVRATASGATWTAQTLYLNLGNTAAPPAGALQRDATGYCPPDRQHPRVLIAGDLRSSRGQRIMTATGSGADAALIAYYRLRLG